MNVKTPYGPSMTAKLPQDSVASQLAMSAKKPGPIYPSGTLGVMQTSGGSGMKHRSASPPLADNP